VVGVQDRDDHYGSRHEDCRGESTRSFTDGSYAVTDQTRFCSGMGASLAVFRKALVDAHLGRTEGENAIRMATARVDSTLCRARIAHLPQHLDPLGEIPFAPWQTQSNTWLSTASAARLVSWCRARVRLALSSITHFITTSRIRPIMVALRPCQLRLTTLRTRSTHLS
jgi:hypothetical protein